jgi:hypothetical protein
MPAPLLAAFVLLTVSKPLDFYAEGPYDPSVPRPESILGYGPGNRITTFRDQERVVLSIAGKAAAKVRTFEYGRSVQGRPLKVFAISSPGNIGRLEAIRKDLQTLANPAPGQDTSAIQARTPAVVWINQCIHGNEPASFESAMWLMYNLAASKGQRIGQALDNALVILNPVYNPDGHERFAVYYNSIAVGASDPNSFELQEPSLIHGRTNAYRFDMNRDRISMSQDETVQEVREYLRWNPQVYVDQHGQVDTYFFPPNPMSVNANVDRTRLNNWTDVIGRATARAFDAKGFPYFIKSEFDLYYPGYLDSWTSLSGAIGMTHETDGGKYLARERRDGSVLTLREGIEKHFVSALAVIESAANNRRDLVASYANFKRRAVSGEHAGKFKRVVVTSEDPRPLIRLRDQLGRSGVQSAFAERPFTQEDANDYWSGAKGKQTFPAGSLVIDMAQSQGPVAKALLEPDADFEPEFLKAQQSKKKTAPEGEQYPGPEHSEFYDLTGWALPYAYNLKAWWCESAPKIAATEAVGGGQPAALAPSSIGYAIRYTDIDDVVAVYDILNAGVRGMVTTKPMKVGGVSYDRGTFLFLSGRNDEGFREKLEKVAANRGVRIEPLKSAYPDAGREGPGSEDTILLRKPNIAVVFGNGSNLSSVGSTWYLMERVFRLPFTPISSSALNGDLSKYTAIVLPPGSNASASGKLKDWVSNGGVAIAFDNIAWALGASNFVALDKVKEEPQSLPGSLFRAELDPRSFLSYGYASPAEGKIELAVPVAGDTFYQPRKEGGSVVTLAKDKARLLLSGWTFENDTDKSLPGTVWLQDAPVGRGHAILFTQDPTERALWPGLYKMFLNAMIIGGN